MRATASGFADLSLEMSEFSSVVNKVSLGVSAIDEIFNMVDDAAVSHGSWSETFLEVSTRPLGFAPHCNGRYRSDVGRVHMKLNVVQWS